MSVEAEVVQFRERVTEVERRLDHVFAHLKLEAPAPRGAEETGKEVGAATAH